MIKFLPFFFCLPLLLTAQERPNVLLILTDDQGYGDLGYHGNPLIRTPALDALAAESVRFTRFYVSPVCAPTRSSLMTGRYSLRTGVRDTYNGGAIMAGEEVTIAEMLSEAGYRTGIFGKWHLGDNYPGRPSDQGFDESLIHLAGGMGQPGDFTNFRDRDSSYFDPVLWHNDQPETYAGYCTDIFAQAAGEFIDREDTQPFFCYLSFNAPHTPLQLKDGDYAPYRDSSVTDYPSLPDLPPRELNTRNEEDARRVYGMVSNIDERVGELLELLERRGIADNTIVIFLTDNGPQQNRYTAGLRGQKGQVYEGGVRVPFFLRYPARLRGDTSITTPAAHIDVLPTLADLCNAQAPTDRTIDGESLLPLFQNEETGHADRSLFLYWNRKYPVPYENMAVVSGRDKLVGYTNYDATADSFALYDLQADPGEQQDIGAVRPAVRDRLYGDLQARYRELVASFQLIEQVRIVIDTAAEHPVYLNRNDAGGERGIWVQEEVFGQWALDVATPGEYRLTYEFIDPVPAGGTLYAELGTRIYSKVATTEGRTHILPEVSFSKGPVDLIPFYEVDGRRIFPLWVKIN